MANLIALVDLFYQTQVFFCVYRGIFPSFVEFYNFTGFSSEFFRFSRHFFCFYFSVFFRIFLQNDMMTFLGLTNIFPDLRNIFPNFNIFLDFWKYISELSGNFWNVFGFLKILTNVTFKVFFRVLLEKMRDPGS